MGACTRVGLHGRMWTSRVRNTHITYTHASAQKPSRFPFAPHHTFALPTHSLILRWCSLRKTGK